MTEINQKTKGVRIHSLEVENLKRIKAVKMQLTGKALTVIGGRNGQGKTSVLDSIAYALGGERFRPTNAKRDSSVVDPEIKLTLSNGLIVERKGKNSALKVIDPEGRKGGQQLLNEFVHQFALDLPKFLTANEKEKANALLQVIGVGEQLEKLDNAERKAYDERHALGVIVDRKKKYAEEMPYFSDAPEEVVSSGDLVKRQQAIIQANADNQRKRDQAKRLEKDVAAAQEHVADIKRQLMVAEGKLNKLTEEHKAARSEADKLVDESTESIELRLEEIEQTNSKARANLDKQKALEDAEEGKKEYDQLTGKVESIRMERQKLLDGANLPLPELSVKDGSLLYKGQRWDCMSGSEQLIVATAIVQKLNPQCGFVLLDKLEQLDAETLNEFGEWLEEQGLQAIATRVSTGGECSIIIEDGTAVLENAEIPVASKQPEHPAKAAPKKEFTGGF